MAPRIDQPQPGFYRTKLVRNGPNVPARIWWDNSIPERPAVLLAELNGKDIPVEDLWCRVAGRNIPMEEYDYMMRLKDHVEKYEPGAPEAQPTKRIDLSCVAAIGPRS